MLPATPGSRFRSAFENAAREAAGLAVGRGGEHLALDDRQRQLDAGNLGDALA